MKFRFETREKEILSGLLLMVKTRAEGDKNKPLLKRSKKLINQLSPNSATSNLKATDVRELKDILGYVLEDASNINEDGMRGLSEEDESTVIGIVAKIEEKVPTPNI